MRRFLDTNILVYADDLEAGAKRERAQGLLADVFASGEGVVSTQVLQEFFAVSTRQLGVEPATARRKIELLATLDVVQIDELLLAAIGPPALLLLLGRPRLGDRRGGAVRGAADRRSPARPGRGWSTREPVPLITA